MAETIGVIGAGALGTLLATRLARAGHSVRGRPAAQHLTAHGVHGPPVGFRLHR